MDGQIVDPPPQVFRILQEAPPAPTPAPTPAPVVPPLRIRRPLKGIVVSNTPPQNS